MTRKLSDDQINTLADNLLGTCSSIDDHLPNGLTFDDLDVEDCELLDDKVVQCADCGWWCEMSEINEDGQCGDCEGE